MSEPTRAAFAGGDQQYLKADQYADTSNLDARANLHHRYTTAAERWQPWMVARIPWPADGAVLEVGCGTGTIWEFGGEVPNTAGLIVSDLSAGMVRASLSVRGQLAPDESTDGVVSDAQALPYPHHTFSLAIANHMLYHLPDPSLGIAEMARVLRPGATLAAATNGAHHLEEILEIERAVFPELGPGAHLTVSVFGLENGAALLADSFENVRLMRYADVLAVTEPADLLAYLRSYPPGQTATADQDAALVAEVNRRFAEGNGVVQVRKDVGLFLATAPQG